jgi:SPP1 family predicted phage head-tail adaptor
VTAGSLDRLIQFRRATLTDDGLGMVETWADHGQPVWASKKDASDAERWRAGEVQAHITTRFTVRYSAFTAALTPKDRIVSEDGREFDISGIKEVGQRRTFLEITAAARAD